MSVDEPAVARKGGGGLVASAGHITHDTVPGPETAGLTEEFGPGDGALLRVRLDLGYDGTDFAGWAAQPGQRTVEGELTTALGTVLRLDPPPRLTVAGRTDTGVHARGQVAHVDISSTAWTALPGRSSSAQPAASLVRRLAGVLPPDVRVHRACVVPGQFDARFGALWRRYAFRITDAPGGADPLRRHEVLAWPHELDAAAMDAAGTGLTGVHDFAAYCRAREGATTIRELQALSCARTETGPDAGLVVVTVRADAFCHSMVRSLVGALLAVGEGRRPVEWPSEVLAAGRRDPSVHVAPAHGLTLEEVAYPAAADLAARTALTRRRRPHVAPTGSVTQP